MDIRGYSFKHLDVESPSLIVILSNYCPLPVCFSFFLLPSPAVVQNLAQNFFRIARIYERIVVTIVVKGGRFPSRGNYAK